MLSDEFYIRKERFKFSFKNYTYEQLITERDSLYKKLLEFEKFKKKNGKNDDYELYFMKYNYRSYEDADLDYLFNLYAFASISDSIAKECKKRLIEDPSFPFILE